MPRYRSRSSQAQNERTFDMNVLRVFLLTVVIGGFMGLVMLWQSIDPASQEPSQQVMGIPLVYVPVIFAMVVCVVFGVTILSSIAASIEHNRLHNELEAARGAIDYATIFDAYNQLCRGLPPDRPMSVNLYKDGDLNQNPSLLAGQGEWETLFLQLPYLLKHEARASRLGISLNFTRQEVRKAQDRYIKAVHGEKLMPVSDLWKYIPRERWNDVYRDGLE